MKGVIQFGETLLDLLECGTQGPAFCRRKLLPCSALSIRHPKAARRGGPHSKGGHRWKTCLLYLRGVYWL